MTACQRRDMSVECRLLRRGEGPWEQLAFTGMRPSISNSCVDEHDEEKYRLHVQSDRRRDYRAVDSICSKTLPAVSGHDSDGGSFAYPQGDDSLLAQATATKLAARHPPAHQPESAARPTDVHGADNTATCDRDDDDQRRATSMRPFGLSEARSKFQPKLASAHPNFKHVPTRFDERELVTIWTL